MTEEVKNYLTGTSIVETCVAYQMNKAPEYLREEMVQEVWEILLEMDESKVLSAYTGNHLSALVTRIVSNQYYSKNSYFHRKYRKMQNREDEIDNNTLNIPDPDSDSS